MARRLPGPKVVSIVDGTEAARLTLPELERMGFSLCLFALTTLLAGLGAQAAALARLAERGSPQGLSGGFDYAGFSELVELGAHQAFAHDFET